MQTYESVVDAIAKIGFPAAFGAALAIGVHYWMVCFYRDIAKPICLEMVTLMVAARKNMGRMSRSLNRIADRYDPKNPPPKG